jgi:hypothetical protein
MEFKNNQSCILFLVSIFLAAACVLSPGAVLADSGDNVSGFAWSENIGWVTSNCTDTGTCADSDYGINIGADEKLSGYAWSENIGWITFNESDLAGCPTGPCAATVDLDCPAGKCTVSGWAKVLANGGGWDGWVKLGGTAQDGSPYPLYIDSSTGEFHGWAWSDQVLGWLSFNCQDQAICGTSDYKLRTNYGFVRSPAAAMSCDSSQCSGGTCNPTTWVSYRPVADPTLCIYKIVNDSTDPDGLADIVRSEWAYKVQGADDSTYQTIPGCPNFDGISDCTLQSGLPAGDYTIKLTVRDAASNSDSVTHDIAIKAEVTAGFMCSLDNINWRDCGPLSGKIAKDATVYFKDDPSLSIHSFASDGESINNREWLWNGGVIGGNSESASVTIVAKTNTIRLTVSDTGGRSDYLEYELKSKSIPDWEEVTMDAPERGQTKLIGFILNRFLAGIYRF